MTSALSKPSLSPQEILQAVEALEGEPFNYVVNGVKSLDAKRQTKDVSVPETASQRTAAASDEWNTVMSAYQGLLDRKFKQGLTSEEEIELHSLGSRLDELDVTSPIEKAIDKQAQTDHNQRMNTLNNIISQLRQLEGSSP